MKVFVYFNLHKKLWSVKSLEGPQKGRVIAHEKVVQLHTVTPKVSQKGRERVLREKRKNVHAGLVGYWEDFPIIGNSTGFITYNPYKGNSFVYLKSGEEYAGSSWAYMSVKESRPKVLSGGFQRWN